MWKVKREERSLQKLAHVAGIKGEGKGKTERVNRVSMRKGDACKDTVDFFISPLIK